MSAMMLQLSYAVNIDATPPTVWRAITDRAHWRRRARRTPTVEPKPVLRPNAAAMII